MRVGARTAINAVSAVAVFALTSCAGHEQSVVDPSGPQSGKIAGLWWFFFWLLAIIFVLVMGFMLRTLTRGHRGIQQEPLEAAHMPPEPTEARLQRIVTWCTIATVVIIFILIVSSVGTGKAISELGNKKNGLTVEVTGNQWWWQIRYLNSDPSQVVVTANEIHIPV